MRKSFFLPIAPLAEITVGSLLLLFTSGCTTGQIGGEVDEAASGCVVENEESIGSDEETPFGLTGKELLATLGGGRTSLGKFEESSTSLVISASGNDDEVTVTITPDPESLALVERSEKQSGGEAAQDLAAPRCDDQIKVDAKVVLRSKSGALDESLTTSFVFQSASLAVATIALEAPLDGSLRVTTKEDGELSLKLSLALAKGTLSGSLDAQLETKSGATSAAGSFPVLAFPLEKCGIGYPLALDGVEVEAALALVRGTGPFAFSWPSGEKTELAIEHTLTSACLEAFDYASEDTIVLGLSSKLTTADGGIDGTFELQGRATLGNDGSITSIHVQRDAYLANYFSRTSFAEETGISGFVFESGTNASFDFTIDDLPNDELGATGQMTFFSIEPPAECPDTAPDENSAPGCAGIEATEVGTATFAKK